MRLPADLGVLRVQCPSGVRFFVSDALTREEELAGRLLATERALGGCRPFVAVSSGEILEALKDATGVTFPGLTVLDADGAT